MPIFIITTDRGQKFRSSEVIDSTAAMEAFNNSPEARNSGMRAVSAEKELAETQRVRSIAQGVTLGFAEEIEAAVRSFVPGGPEYSQIRDELRTKLADYKKDHPYESIGYEIAGALVPALLTRGATAEPSLARMAGTGFAEGVVSGYGYGEGTGLEQTGGAGVSGVISAGLNPIFFGFGKVASEGVSALTQFAREKFGGRMPEIVRNEIDRLVVETGKTPDEIIDDIASGSLMAENRSLFDTIKAYRASGGATQTTINQAVRTRRDQTNLAAMNFMQESLSGGRGVGNARRIFNATDDQLRVAERNAYTGIFGEVPEVTPEIAATIEDILQRFPEARAKIGRIYQSGENLVPLYKVEDTGRLTLSRIPTLEDAEILRRTLRDESFRLSQPSVSEGTLSGLVRDARNNLQNQLDSTYTELISVRAAAESLRNSRDAFKVGTKALRENSDEIELIVEKYADDPQALAGLRLGFMDAIRNQNRRRPGLMGKLADPESTEGENLRIIFPEDSANEAIRLASIADDAVYNMKVRSGQGSPTAPTQMAAQRSAEAAAQTYGVAGNIATGNIRAVLEQLVKRAAPQLNDKQRNQIAQVLFSSDPEFVRRALIDDGFTTQLLGRISSIANVLGGGLRSGLLQQQAQYISPEVSNLTSGLLGQQQ